MFLSQIKGTQRCKLQSSVCREEDMVETEEVQIERRLQMRKEGRKEESEELWRRVSERVR